MYSLSWRRNSRIETLIAFRSQRQFERVFCVCLGERAREISNWVGLIEKKERDNGFWASSGEGEMGEGAEGEEGAGKGAHRAGEESQRRSREAARSYRNCATPPASGRICCTWCCKFLLPRRLLLLLLLCEKFSYRSLQEELNRNQGKRKDLASDQASYPSRS